MRTRLPALILMFVAVTGVGRAADRHWQTGTWTNVDISRQLLDFGPGASGFGGPPNNAAPNMKAMAEVHVYTIETDVQVIVFKDVVAVGRRSLDAVVGVPVTFALNKKTIYVRDDDGVEHKFNVTRTTIKPKHAV